MSDLESFNPGEGGESYDPAAFERFKEQIKKNAAFVAAIRKGEQKQKLKEDRLAKILLKFIQSNQKSGILLLAAKLLEENIPASFILSLIILGNEEIANELKREMKADSPQIEGGNAQKLPSEFSIMPRFADESLTIKIKVGIDDWGKGILEAASSVPFRVLETALDREGKIKKPVIDCASNVLGDFILSNNGKIVDYDTYYSFCEFLMRGVMNHIQKQIENQKELN